MPTRRQGTLAVAGALFAALCLALLVRELWQAPGRRGPGVQSIELEGGGRLQFVASDCDPTEIAERLPGDVNAAIRSQRARELEQILAVAPASQCETQVVDGKGELRDFVRARARRQATAGRRVLLVGWDGADPRVIDDLLKVGYLSALGRLRVTGAHGVLVSHAPYLSPLLWTSVATGKRPEEHGILDFVEAGANGQVQPIGSTCRRSTTLWQIASDLGRSALVVNWWATEPEDLIRGEVVSDRWVRDPEFVGHPDRSGARVKSGDPAVQAVFDRLVRGHGSEEARDHDLRSFIAEVLTAHAQALRGLASNPDLAMVYYQLIDEAGHLFAREMPPRQTGVAEDSYARYGGVVHGSYLLLDALLGELISAAPEREIIVMSDHGFVYGLERQRGAHLQDPLSDLLHTPAGIYVMSGSFTKGAGPALDLHDIAPTVLAAMGLPPADDMAGVVASVYRGVRPEPVATHEVELAPPGLGLVTGTGCGASGAGGPSREAVEKLEALGYIESDGGHGGMAVWPLANLGRSLMDARRTVEASEAFRLASDRRPQDATIGQLLLEATLGSGRASVSEAETMARRWLRDDAGAVRGDLAFPLIQLRLRQGDEAGAGKLAAEVEEQTMGGVLTRLVLAMWQRESQSADRLFGKALQLDILRAVDAVQGLGEVFPDRDLGIDGLLERYADDLPQSEIARSPASGLSRQPEATLARARRASTTAPSAVDRLWLRRAEAYRLRDGAGEP